MLRYSIQFLEYWFYVNTNQLFILDIFLFSQMEYFENNNFIVVK